jgi:hypothetical protein
VERFLKLKDVLLELEATINLALVALNAARSWILSLVVKVRTMKYIASPATHSNLAQNLDSDQELVE